MRFAYFSATIPLNLWIQAPLTTSARWSKASQHGNQKKKKCTRLKTWGTRCRRRIASGSYWCSGEWQKGSVKTSLTLTQPLAVCLIRRVPLRLPLWRKTNRPLSLKDGVTQSVASLLWGWAGKNSVCYSSVGLTRVSPAGPPEPGNLEVSSGQQKQNSMKVQAAFSQALISWNELRENAKMASVFRE